MKLAVTSNLVMTTKTATPKVAGRNDAAGRRTRSTRTRMLSVRSRAAADAPAPRGRPGELRKLGDSDLMVSEICLGSMTWGKQNTERWGFDWVVGRRRGRGGEGICSTDPSLTHAL